MTIMKRLYILTSLFCLIGLTSCFNLDKAPEGVLSTTNAFSSTGEIRNYLDQFYETGVRTQDFTSGSASGIAGDDMQSDNMASSVVDTRLAGETALSDASKLTNYTYIRNVNFLIKNLGNCQDKSTEYYQYVGEAYYFRAWYYYQMFIDYGQLTWVDEPLDPSQEQMEKERDSRTVIADHILADLDLAIENLNAQNDNSTMRIHKDVARALKSEVALFEGTWEKYHKAKGDAFYDKTITDEKIKNYLTQAAQAAKNVIDRGVWSIYKGSSTLTAYRDLFKTADLTNNPEVLWYKRYDGDNVGNSVTRYLNKGGGGTGVTLSLIDDYLTIDGKPFVGAAREEAQKVYGDELKPTVRDPRLSQTICLPGQSLRPNGGYTYTVPPLDGNSNYLNTTGYSLFKYVEFDTTNAAALDTENKGSTPAIQFRYADILLNYAEALAELDGAGNAELIKTALKPLRDRVGMPGVDFDREYNTAADYPFHALDKYIQAVRRERRIEKACEGRRFEDIQRWAAADVLIRGQLPKGALFIGSNLEHSYTDLIYDKASDNNLYLTGTTGDAKRYVSPLNPKDFANGWQFNLDRDYLLPIQERMLSLTGNKWVQNPGW
jgi:hypothetical protein